MAPTTTGKTERDQSRTSPGIGSDETDALVGGSGEGLQTGISSKPSTSPSQINNSQVVLDQPATSTSQDRNKPLRSAVPHAPRLHSGSVMFSHKDGWLDEILASIVSVLTLAAFLGVLVYFDGRGIPELGHHLTLNGLISVLTTTIRLSLALSLSGPLGQLKWLWMAEKRRPLSDIAVFDKASRGPRGASDMIIQLRGSSLALMGAFLILIVPGFEVSMQQAVQYPTVRVASQTLNASIVNSEIGTAVNNLAPGFEDPGLIAAVYDGIFGNAFVTAPKSIPFFCPSGNCTWDSLPSLGVCSFCSNITDQLTAFGNYSALCDAKVAAYDSSVCGPIVQNSDVNWLENPPLYQLYTKDKSTAFPDLPSYLLSVFVLENSQPPGPLAALSRPPELTWATECALQYCVQTYDIVVVGGNLQRTLKSISQSFFANFTLQNSGAEPPELGATLSSIIQGNITGDNESSGPVVTRFYALGDAGALLLNLTIAIGVWLNTADVEGYDLVNGTVWVEEVQVHVVWPWITLPALLVIGSCVFLVMTMALSRQKSKTHRSIGIWKNDALALLFHGLDADTRASLPAGSKKTEMSMSAKEASVRLDGDEDLRNFLRAERKAEFTNDKVNYRRTF